MPSLLLTLLACSLSEPDVGIAPRPAPSSVDLVVTPDPPVGETWSYRWSVGGDVQADLVGNRVPAARTLRGERWKVIVERRVGRRVSKPAEASIVVSNGLPTVQAAIVEANDGLQAIAFATDPDGEPVTVSWSWELDEAVVQEGGVLPTEELAGGQTWTLRAWGSDGDDRGPDALATYTVGNQAPRLDSATITPSDPTSLDDLQIAFDGLDPDGDALTVEVEWRADSEPLATGSPLAAGVAPKGPWIDALVTLSDGQARSQTVVAPGVRLVNTPPTIDLVEVEPRDLAFGISPVCVVEGWYDPDGDLEELDVRWFIDSVVYEGVGSPSGTILQRGQHVQCEATPVDDEDRGRPMLSLPALVLNSPPSVARVFLEPDKPTALDPIEARLETVYDPDGDVITIEAVYYVDGVEAGSDDVVVTKEDPTFEVSVSAVRDQVLEIEATPFDGIATGIPVFAEVLFVNAPPTVSGLTTSPSPPQPGVDLVPIFTASDADGDPVDVQIEWEVDGGPITEAPLLPGSVVTSGSLITVRVTPFDGTDGGMPAELVDLVVP